MKIGILGLGHLGKIHLRCLKLLPQWNVVGYYDPEVYIDDIPRFPDADSLIEQCDALDIVATTGAHHELILKALKAGKHLFVEKPMTALASEAEEIRRQIRDEHLVVQVGHVERFNPAWRAVSEQIKDPRYVEITRFAPYNVRGTDVSVIMDLMIHDIDLVLSIMQSPVDEVQASGYNMMTDSIDHCNARITFKDGAVANITSSRISELSQRYIRLFQKDAYISVDLMRRESKVVRITERMPEEGLIKVLPNRLGRSRYMAIHRPEIIDTNAIVDELRQFYACCMHGYDPWVSIDEATTAIQLAERIANQISLVQHGA